MDAPEPLTVGSLFAGIGGFDLGFERAGMRTVWQVEQDEFCRKVLAKHFPNAERYEDVRDVGRTNLARVDVVCGGFPCQDISVAGRGAGIEGERSGLWSEYARLVGELRPRYVVVENVAALLGRGLGVVLGDLAALGYDAEWDCIPASAVGAPHQRDRLWLVAYADREFVGVQQVSRPERETASISRDDGPTRDMADPAGERRGQGDSDARRSATRDGAWEGRGPHGRREGPGLGDWWTVEPDLGRVANGVPARMDRLKSLGNALVPQIAEWIGRRILEHEKGRVAN